MRRQVALRQRPSAVAFIAAFSLCAADSHAVVDGLTGATFNLTAKSGHISGADGLSLHVWGYANGAGPVQYPGPTLIVTEGTVITVNLTNELAVPVSIVFPGQEGVTHPINPGAPGLLTRDAPTPGGIVTYQFTASRPGTYHYHSGTRPDLQVEMGLFGAMIVRPAGFNPLDPVNRTAYGHVDSAFDVEYLFLFSEMDLKIHQLVEFGRMAEVDTTTFNPVYWFINGRNLPDVLLPAFVPWLPNQPYNCLPIMYPGERLLKRVIGGGRDIHPHHPHGNSVTMIARDGRLMGSAPGSGADLSPILFTITSAPGQTVDGIFEWTGEGMGWDIYGTGAEHEHSCNAMPVTACTEAAPAACQSAGFDPVTKEYCPDHGKVFPVILPGPLEFTEGIAYSGSPFLGTLGALPPGEGGYNPWGGFFYPWHSHHEKEVCNNDIFPGGMFTFLIILPHP